MSQDKRRPPGWGRLSGGDVSAGSFDTPDISSRVRSRKPDGVLDPAAMAKGSHRLSIIPASAVFDTRIGSADLRVLCAIAAYADRSGKCWPATTTLASELGVSDRRVRSCLRNLERRGYLKTEHRSGQRSLYLICREASDPGTSVSGVEGYPGTSPSGGAEPELPGTPEGELPPKDTTNRFTEHILTVASLADQQFEVFWRTFPSRRPHSNPKKPARAKFKAAVKCGVAAADIIRGAENFAAYVEREGTDPKFVPQAQTWLNQERWTQYQEAAGSEPAPLML